MDTAELDRRKRVMDELVDDIVQIKRWFAARDIDVSDPVEREVIDGFKRIQRQCRSRGSKQPADAHQEAE